MINRSRTLPIAPQERMVELDLRDALRETISALSQVTGGRTGVDADLQAGATIAAHPSRLHQLLLTLLLDAARSLSDHRRLHVWVRRTAGRARILIDGRGPGLPHSPHDREAYKAALTNLIDHHGKLVIHTRAGIGSTYELEFPVAA